MSSDPNNRVRIALKENGLHSLWKGIEAYEKAKSGDDWSLKEAVMFIHHGVELLMKQILVNHSEYLLFEDLGETTVRKQKQANQQGIGVFFLNRPPRSVTFTDALRRVDVFVAPAQLEESLITWLDQLNSLRNQIEHYAIDVEKEDVMKLLGKIHEPLIALFDAQLGGVRESQPVPVIKAWESINSVMERALEAENRIATLVSRFQGQAVEGNLFGTDGTVQLPVVKQVFQSRRWNIGDISFEIDVVAEAEDAKWVVEVKATQRLNPDPLYRMQSLSRSFNATPWLAFMGTATAQNFSLARNLGVFLSDKERIDALETVVKKV
jgi:hypothetical protein